MGRDSHLHVFMSSVERRGPWKVPEKLEIRVRFGNCELDLRNAEMGDDTTFDLAVSMGNVEIIVPPELIVAVDIRTTAGNVEEQRAESVGTEGMGAVGKQAGKRLRITGNVKLGNCEVIALRRDETIDDHARRLRHEIRRHRQHHRHLEHHKRLAALRAERDMWRAHPERSLWMPWWLQARMRRRIFLWFTVAFIAGAAAGVHFWGHPRWFHFVIAIIGLSFVSGAVAWSLTRPLLLVVQAARDIGDGKYDTRLDTRQRGEMNVLATAINEMAAKIEQQMKDQRQLLAAVSHELRTPLGHMRILIETARDTGDMKALCEVEKEVLTLDDLVGRLLASSRLEFGNLDRRPLDLGELLSDVATSAGLPPEAIEAVGDVRVDVDPTLIRRAIANLIENARVHAGGAIAVRAVRRGGQVAIEVDDAGPGVPAGRRADAFRAFTPSTGGGLGLGLALVSRIAVAHDGGAWITDRPGGGARVGFTVGIGPSVPGVGGPGGGTRRPPSRRSSAGIVPTPYETGSIEPLDRVVPPAGDGVVPSARVVVPPAGRVGVPPAAGVGVPAGVVAVPPVVASAGDVALPPAVVVPPAGGPSVVPPAVAAPPAEDAAVVVSPADKDRGK